MTRQVQILPANFFTAPEWWMRFVHWNPVLKINMKDVAFGLELKKRLSHQCDTNTLCPNRYYDKELGGLATLGSLDSTDNVDDSLSFQRLSRVVVFIDLVDSVRLIERNELKTIDKWTRFVAKIESDLLPVHGGVLKKSLGDGLLLHFSGARDATACALAVQEACHAANRSDSGGIALQLRVGIEAAEVVETEYDIFGHGVNVAARLMGMANADEVVVSGNVRDHLVQDVDADIEDLGECYLKNVSKPVRAFRIGTPRRAPARPVPENSVVEHDGQKDRLVPNIAVLPLVESSDGTKVAVLGDLVSDEIIEALSASQYLTVISRLSTAQMRGRELSLSDLSNLLDVNYVLSGRYHARESSMVVFLELADATSQEIIWSTRVVCEIGSLFSEETDFAAGLACDLHSAIFGYELSRVRTALPPNLQSYSLLLGAITLMHRMSPHDFRESFHLLELAIERWGRESIPHAWMAKWYVLRAQQGWSEDPDRDSFLAMDCAKRALDADPNSSLALTVDGLVHTHMLRAHDVAQDRYTQAVSANPSNALAWLLKGTAHAFTGDGAVAVENTQRAIRLSPIDPHRYYFDTLAATAFLANNQYDDALAAAEKSLRANKAHTSSLRAKAVALWQLGRHDEARATGGDLLAREPNLTISGWRARSPASGQALGDEWANLLKEIGVPE